MDGPSTLHILDKLLNTLVRPSRDLRNNYADLVKSLKQHDHIIITNNGVGESVLIGIEDYAAYEEFLHCRFVYGEAEAAREQTKAQIQNRSLEQFFSAIDAVEGEPITDEDLINFGKRRVRLGREFGE